MALFTPQEINTIVNAVKMADKDTRNEFYQGKVVGENDYTSTMLTRIRNDINKNSSSLNAKYLAQLLPPAAERKWGVDACIIFIDNQGTNTKTVKIGLFEAKVKKRKWDYLQTNNTTNAPESHFSSQLKKQADLLSKHKDIAIWEQFYTHHSSGSLPGANMSTWGSSCVEHGIAVQHNNSSPHANNKVWSEKDITTICSNQVNGLLQTVEMYEFVEELLQCNFGKPIPNSSIKDICDQLPMLDTLIISNNIQLEENEMAVKSIYSEYLKGLLTD